MPTFNPSKPTKSYQHYLILLIVMVLCPVAATAQRLLKGPTLPELSASRPLQFSGSVPASPEVSMIAQSMLTPAQTGGSGVNAPSSLSIEVSPKPATVAAGGRIAFSVQLANAPGASVNWSVRPGLGSISSDGVYTAPTQVAEPTVVTVRATLNARTRRTHFDESRLTIMPVGAAVPPVVIPPPVTIMVSPSAVSMNPGQSIVFVATVSGAANTAVAWSISPPVGSISALGVYTAPASVASAQAVTVRATSLADPTRFAAAAVSIQPPAQPVTVSVSPAAVNLQQGQTQIFSASVTGSQNTAVAWSISPLVGSINAVGMYTAPASVASAQTVTVRATSLADASRFAVAAVVVQPPAQPVTVSVSPAAVNLQQGQTQVFSASVSGSPNTAVEWSISPVVGSINAAGVYTAPASVASAQTVTVRATSQADTARFATAAVSLQPAVSVTVTPATASLGASGTVTVTATVSGMANTGVTWSVSPAGVGSLSTSGSTGVYVAPSSVTANQTVEVRAASMADPTKFARLMVALLPTVSVTVSPQTVTLMNGQSHRFTASVANSANTGVTWSLSPSVGTIGSDGAYVAPAQLSAPTQVTVTAQSQADPARRGTAQVNLQVNPDTRRVEFTVSADRLTSLRYGGVDYYLGVDYVIRGPEYVHPDGTVHTGPWERATRRTKTSNPEGFIHVFNEGSSRQHTAVVEYATPDNRTLHVKTCITNNDQVQTLRSLSLELLSFRTPGPARQFRNQMPMEVNQFNGRPAEFLSGDWGSVAFWMGPFPSGANYRTFYGRAEDTDFRPELFTSYPFRGVQERIGQILPRQTHCVHQYLRFGGPQETLASLAPDALESFRREVPYIVNWPDRRPIANWMIAEFTRTSKTNPRGYWWEPSLDASNATAFRARMRTALQGTLSIMNGMSPRPQGIIIWDIEGQEFAHAFTYIGHPDRLPVIAPEMDAAADEFFQTIRNAGYRVGVTLRPQTFGAGPVLPTTCAFNTNSFANPRFVVTTAAWPNRSFRCRQGNVWEVTPYGGGWQTSLADSDEDIYNLLKMKIGYARQRWGATLYYLDSNVYAGGAAINHTIYRRLAQDFPDCLIFPELESIYDWGSGAPYNQLNMGYKGTPDRALEIYPGAFSLINVADGDIAGNMQALTESVRRGDILLFRAWFNSPEIPALQQVYANAGK